MQITVKAFATLYKFMPPDADKHPVTDGLTAGQLAEQLGIPAEDLHLIFVNSTRVEPDHVLQDGDRVGFFPAVGGG